VHDPRNMNQSIKKSINQWVNKNQSIDQYQLVNRNKAINQTINHFKSIKQYQSIKINHQAISIKQ